ELGEIGELGAEGERRGGLLEAQALAVEAQRSLQVTHADPEVGDPDVHASSASDGGASAAHRISPNARPRRSSACRLIRVPAISTSWTPGKARKAGRTVRAVVRARQEHPVHMPTRRSRGTPSA